MGEPRRKGATESGRIERPKHRTTTAGESVHDAETWSKAREPRDNRRTSQGAAVARGFAREGTAFVARTFPTKSTVVQPHLSALSCVPITCTAAHVPRAKERANLMPLSTLECAWSTHGLATQSSSVGTMDTQPPRRECGSSLLRQRNQPPAAGERTSAVTATQSSRRVREYHRPPHVLHKYPNHARAPRRSGRGSCQRPAHVHVRAERSARADHGTERAGGSDGRKGSGRECARESCMCEGYVCTAANRRSNAVPEQRLCGGTARCTGGPL